jgi:hypothetical protein
MLAICYREVGDEPLRQFEEEVWNVHFLRGTHVWK